MSQRDYDRSRESRRARSQTASTPSSAGPVLALQRALGNRGMGQVLARKGPATFEHSVRIGKLGPIEVTDSNIADWIGKKADAEDLVVTTTKGKHSAELKRMSDTKARVGDIEIQSIIGENSWVIVTFKNAVITGYALDPSGKTEQWKAIRFDAVDIKRTSIGKPRA